MLLLLHCPKCGHEQQMRPLSMDDYQKKRKACVYCGKTFKVQGNITKRLE